MINYNNNRHIGLDHLRAFAICYVVLFHYRLFEHPNWLDRVGEFGWTGVDLFFVLSGFLIAGQLFEALAKGRVISVKGFFTKRFFRIIPPYLVILSLYLILPDLRERENMAPLWRYLTFTTNFGLDISKIGTFTHSWSLCIEEQFYLILPLCIYVFYYLNLGKRAVYLIILLFISGFVIRYLNWHWFMEPNINSEHFGAMYNQFIYYPTYDRLDGLLVGVSIAGLYKFYPVIKVSINRYSNIVMLVGIVLLVLSNIICTPQQTFITAIWGYPLIAISYGLIVAAIVCPGNLLYNLKSCVTYYIATLSYSIYLVHKLAIHITQELLGSAGIEKNSNIMMICCLLSTVLGAVLLRQIIEIPSLKIRDALLRKHEETAAAIS